MMKLGTTLKILASTTVAYVLIAACAGGGGGGGFAPDGGLLDALYDTLTNPDQKAQAAPPIVVQSACDKQYVNPTSGATYYYAEAAFPGKSVQDLSAVRVVAQLANPSEGGFGPDYPYAAVAGGALKDGVAAVNCGISVSGQTSMSYTGPITFILPQ